MSGSCDGTPAKPRGTSPGGIRRSAAAKPGVNRRKTKCVGINRSPAASGKAVRSPFLPTFYNVVVIVIVVVFTVGGVESTKYADLLKCWDAEHWSYVPLPRDGVNSTKAQEEFDERHPRTEGPGDKPWREWDCLENQVVVVVVHSVVLA